MAETIKIGGELESVATGGIVAAASAIKDKTKNMTQEQVNAETDETLAAHSSAISGFEGGNFVTLVATDADADIAAVFTRLSVTPAVNIIYRIANWKHNDADTKYNTAYYSEYAANGTTIADLVPISVENKGIDDVPTAESENLIKSGGVQNELALGAVYDVSAKNPTAGPNNDGKWGSLSALLSDANLSTLIPTAWRKGGMSIRFVSSSDNRYVQFRYMLQYENTTAGNNAFKKVTNWQGEDIEPIAESKNIANSGGINKMFVSLSEYFHINTPSVGEVDGAVNVNSSGVISASTIHRGIFYFPVQQGDIIHFNTKNNDSSNLSGAAIAVTSDTIPEVGSPVLEYQYWSGIPEVDAFYVVKNTGTLYYYVYLPSAQTTSCKVVEPIDKTLIPIERTTGIAYFSLAKSPSFIQIENGIRVQLPDGGMFDLYSQYKGAIIGFNYNTQAGATFDITNKKSLVLDFNDNTFKVVDTGSIGNYATMLSYNDSKAVDGLFKPFYDASITKQINSAIENVANTAEDANEKSTNILPKLYYVDAEISGEVPGNVKVNTEGVIESGTIHRTIRYFSVKKGDIIYFGTKNNDDSNLVAAAIAVTSDVTPTVGSPVLEYQYWSNIPKVDVIYNVKNTGVFYYYVYLESAQTTICKVAKEASEIDNKYAQITQGKANKIVEYQIGSAYINLGYAPTFEKTTNGIHVAFPYQGYRIRVFNQITGTAFDKNIDSNDISGYDLTNSKSLVADLDDDKALKVVDSSAVGNYVVLLTYVSSEAVNGIFKPYYDIWERNRVLNGEIFNLVEYWRNNLCRANITNQIKQGNFEALFFSDIHGNETALSRIIQLANNVWRNNIDVIIDSGDDTQAYQALTNLDWYNTLAPTCAKPIIRAVGNHDAWVNSTWDWATAQQVYEYFTAPAVALMRTKGLTVVQPSDAATAYRNYYYIDFGNIRVIVLLSLTMGENNRYYDNDQDTWFKSVLSDALTNSKSVICVNHGPLNPDSCNQVESNWSSFKKWNTVADNQHVDDAAVAAVDDFIDDGGTFICWLSGHTHIDYLLTSNTGTHKQLCFTTACAKNGTMDGLQPNSQIDPYYDLFNFFSVDLTNKLVKVWRIGFNNNYALQEHNTFCWNYVEEKLVSET